MKNNPITLLVDTIEDVFNYVEKQRRLGRFSASVFIKENNLDLIQQIPLDYEFEYPIAIDVYARINKSNIITEISHEKNARSNVKGNLVILSWEI